MSHPRRPAATAGFTLVELMLVVALVGVLAGIAGLTYRRLWLNERLTAAARSSAGWLEEQRRRAIQQSAICSLRLDAASARLSSAADSPCGQAPPLDLRAGDAGGPGLVVCVSTPAAADTAPACSASAAVAAASATLQFTPRGTLCLGSPCSSDGRRLELHLLLAEAAEPRCVALLSPLGLIRPGRVSGGRCSWATAF